jgi:glycosyltransferase involved in cell wall biosynthesis
VRRILLLITDLQIGGTPTVVRELAVRLRAPSDVHVEVACLSPWGPVADQLMEAGVTVTPLNARGVFDLPAVVRRLVKLIGSHRIDTVFSFLLHANSVAATAGRFCRNVRWLQSIQTAQPDPRWHWRVQSAVQHAAERVVVPSESVARVARDWAGVPAEKVVVIPNAVDLSEFECVRSSRDEAGRGTWNAEREEAVAIHSGRVSRSPFQVGFLGRLDPIKRVPDLLEAVAILGPRVHLHVFGDGPERLHIERTNARLGIAERVTLHGAVARPGDALGKVDLLVLPSQAEGFGLVLIEAMVAGVPVVATDVPGIRDVVRGGETGLLVPVASPSALASAIAELLDDPVRREEMVARARRDVAERFSWERVLPRYRALLGLA